MCCAFIVLAGSGPFWSNPDRICVEFVTLQVIIIPGVGQISNFFGHPPRVSQKWDWAILTHANGRCDYYKSLVSWSNIKKCQHCFQQPDLGPGCDSTPGSAVQTRRIHPPGQISQFHPLGLIMSCWVSTLLSKPGCWEIGFWAAFPRSVYLYYINEAHKWYIVY